MKKLLILMLFSVFALSAFNQNNTVIEPKIDAQTIQGSDTSDFVRTTAPLKVLSDGTNGQLMKFNGDGTISPITSASSVDFDTIVSVKDLQNSLIGSYYNFDRVDDKITLTGLNNQFSFNGSYVIRFKTGNDITTLQYIKGGATPRIYLSIAGGTASVVLGDNTLLPLTSSILANTAYTVVVTWTDPNNDGDGNTDGYVNGEQTMTAQAYTGLTSFPTAMYISTSTGSSGWFGGDVYMNLHYNRILTLNDAKEIALWDSNNPPVRFADAGANVTELTSGTLTIGKRYRINDWITNDDFTNVGGANADGSEFIATGTTPTTWTNSSTVMPAGVVGNWNASGIGHNTWVDASGNDLFATVNGPSYCNIPASDIEEARQDAITTDTQILSSSNLVPDGYVLLYVIGTETAGNAAILDLGTTAGGSDVFSQETFTASTVNPILVNYFNLTGADVALYLNDDGVGTWNSASLNCIFVLQKIK